MLHRPVEPVLVFDGRSVIWHPFEFLLQPVAFRNGNHVLLLSLLERLDHIGCVEFSIGEHPALVFVVFLTSELLFGAALREGERVFSATARHHRGEVFRAVLLQVAAFVGSRRQTKSTRQAKLGPFYDRTIEDYSWDEQVQVTKSFLVMLLSLFIPVVGYGLLAAVGIHTFAVGWMPALLLLLSVLLTSAFFRLWYSNYGLVQVEDRNGYVTFLGEVATFLVVGQIVV
jgi:hypothetical protein